jgi:diguanylate cyclase (GGDEF)-like protein
MLVANGLSDDHDAIDRMLALLRTAPDSRFAPLMVIARELLGMPIAAINLIQGDRLWSKVTGGIDLVEMPSSEAICHHVALGDAPLTIDNCEKDERVSALGLVTDGGLRFYAGVPLHATDPASGIRHTIGAMCVADIRPRTLAPGKLAALCALADLAETVIETQLSTGIAIDVAAIANQQAQELGRQERLFRHAERMAMIGSWRLDLPDNQVHWSPGIRHIHEISADVRLSLENGLEYYPPHARAIVTSTLAEAIESGDPFDFEVDFITATGRHRRVRSMGEVEHDAMGHATALTGVFQDVTDRYLLEQHLRHSASTDPLTGIANRAAFDAALAGAIDRAVAGQGGCTLIVVDLDHFKAINDTHGHPAGDDVLRAVAERLGAPYLAGAFAARLGGDEFAVLLTDPTMCVQADLLTARLADDLTRPVEGNGRTLPLSATLGLAALGDGIASPRDLLSAADDALYVAKRRRRGSTARYGSRA